MERIRSELLMVMWTELLGGMSEGGREKGEGREGEGGREREGGRR